MFGVVNLNKPKGMTSRAALDTLSRVVPGVKVGHAGTLDPLATGVLMVCLGPATRLIKFVQRMPKTYVAVFTLGMESTTEDSEGDVTLLANPPEITEQQLKDCLPEFLGEIQQVPPAFSALKVNGKRAYELARDGKEVELKARPIMIHKLELLNYSYPEFQIKIECGSGTYVRSLGRDIARHLGSGAVMKSLERTKIGRFFLDNSMEVEQLGHQDIRHFVEPALNAVHGLPRASVTAEQITGFLDGHMFKPAADEFQGEDEVVLIDERGRLVAVAERFDDRNFKPKINFAHYWQSLETATKG